MSDLFTSFGAALLNVVMPTLATVLTGLVMLLVRRMATKAGIEISQKNDERLKELIGDAIRVAEEVARREAKKGNIVPGNEKREIAKAKVMAKTMDDATLPAMTAQQVDTLMDSQLSVVRAEVAVAEEAVAHEPIDMPPQINPMGPDPTRPGLERR